MTRPIIIEVGRNNLERDYAARLELLKRSGEIIDWRYEAIRLRLGSGAYYKPDFLVVCQDRIEIHETKGRWMEAARVRIKVAASLYPWFRFIAAQRTKHAWNFEEFKP